MPPGRRRTTPGCFRRAPWRGGCLSLPSSAGSGGLRYASSQERGGVFPRRRARDFGRSSGWREGGARYVATASHLLERHSPTHRLPYSSPRPGRGHSCSPGFGVSCRQCVPKSELSASGSAPPPSAAALRSQLRPDPGGWICAPDSPTHSLRLPPRCMMKWLKSRVDRWLRTSEPVCLSPNTVQRVQDGATPRGRCVATCPGRQLRLRLTLPPPAARSSRLRAGAALCSASRPTTAPCWSCCAPPASASIRSCAG